MRSKKVGRSAVKTIALGGLLQEKMVLKVIAGVCVAGLSSSTCYAFWGISQPEPEVTISYSRAECLPSGGIKLTVRNSSDEALAEIQGTVKVYRPETSRLGAEIDGKRRLDLTLLMAA